MAKEKVSIRKKVGCSIGISVAALLIIFAFCGRFFNSALKYVANFFVGSFGMAFYGIMIAVIVICSFVLAGKKIRVPKKYAAHFILMFVEIVMLVHMFTTIYLLDADYATYAHYVYNYYLRLPTFGGIVFGITVFSLTKIITIYATAVLLFALLGWSVYMVGEFFYSYFTGKLNLAKTKNEKEDILPSEQSEAVQEIDDERARAYRILFPDEHSLHPEEVGTDSFDASREETLPHTRTDAENFLFRSEPQPSKPAGNSYFDRPAEKIKQEPSDELGVRGFRNVTTQMETFNPVTDETSDWRVPTHTTEDDYVAPAITPVQTEAEKPAPQPQNTVSNTTSVFSTVEDDVDDWRTSADTEIPDIVDIVQDSERVPTEEKSLENMDFDLYESEDDLDLPSELNDTDGVQVEEQIDRPRTTDNELIPVETEVPLEGGGKQVRLDFFTDTEIKKKEEKVHKYPRYVAPPIELFNDAVIVEDDDEDFRAQATFNIMNKLSVFGIKVEAAGQVVGPSVTRYMFKVLSLKTKMSEFNQYAQDLKACLQATGEIRIEAPIPGTNLVGIEVANKTRTPVCLRTVLESKSYREKKGALVFVVGQQISGEMIIADLAKLPHLLVAGTTGSGKSVFLHSLIASLIYRYGPEYLRFIMVDPKLVEFGHYNGIPHMLTTETITDATDALAAMDYLIAEMEARYQLFRQVGATNIIDYNSKINPKLVQKLPYLVLVVDELADLMSVSKKSFEAKLQRLAQKARAAGIHLVLATQRPDTQVISGTIKTNFACRVALKVASAVDSGTILGGGGAEKLLGNGDMLYMNPSTSDLQRIQGTYLTDEERDGLVDFVKAQNETFYDPKVSDEIFVTKRQNDPDEASESDAKEAKETKVDPYCKKALRFWLEKQGGRASIASIQRTLQIGFNRAGRIMDTLQKLHYVEQLAPSDPSSKPLKVLVSIDELDKLFPDLED
ncbi:MAG: FtsK/SpoIIIE domain-containing protein [Corallococcus sp.]|nr:FtsK/SpoIIIE domain-containing protein [Corallococcus sp.]MCM1359155.1 FtsK/SpoIIIE domain-containing protein [Corallococcus sp.]MCM1394545.1 FtsK/SpoIIIE domain-containing protein [Corallococcus sp.]